MRARRRSDPNCLPGFHRVQRRSLHRSTGLIGRQVELARSSPSLQATDLKEIRKLGATL